ncbi:hypothetical protein FS749_014077 [Ceratobasidium sp. UAMH 11750]|nr:hypothetical protein FS749_014077 [Ceratobasidium sp. UAMH 11750]
MPTAAYKEQPGSPTKGQVSNKAEQSAEQAPSSPLSEPEDEACESDDGRQPAEEGE